ncbi:MAG: hypothetical protein H6713_11955 [Myxococcales bacterium]|nr:hypothetical protein [Myxococcales bacterium]MCB9750690.1 hypothetical protein [Myxococcales bacterium]
MPENEVSGGAYRVWATDEDPVTIHFSGSMRLPMKDYEPVSKLLAAAHERSPNALVMDFQDLTFLNSSGINMVFRFVITLRRRGGVDLEVRGKESIQWQTKSLTSVRKFLPDARIVLNK